jgi:hypothetical protein
MAVLWTPKGPEGEEKAFFAKRNGGESNVGCFRTKGFFEKAGKTAEAADGTIACASGRIA